MTLVVIDVCWCLYLKQAWHSGGYYANYPCPFPVCIDVTDRVYPSLAFFGRQTEVFVQLHAEPPPTSLRPEVIYADSLPSDHSVLNVSENVYPATGDDLALLTYVYTFSVLEVADVSTIDRAELEFSVTLHHESPSCTDVHIFKSNIPVVQPFGECRKDISLCSPSFPFPSNGVSYLSLVSFPDTFSEIGELLSFPDVLSQIGKVSNS